LRESTLSILGLEATNLLWVALWGLVGAGFVLLVRAGFDYIRGFWVTALYFAVGTFVAGRLFWSILEPRVRCLHLEHAVWGAGVIAIYLLVHLWLRRTRVVEESITSRYPHIYWLRLDDRYVFSKVFEILFQQTMVVTLTLFLSREGFRGVPLALFFMVLFAAVHLPIVKLVGPYFGRYYLLSSLGAAALFPFVILRTEDGHAVSYLIHVGYYIVSTILFASRWYPRRRTV
jgi:hypothetical protein